MKFSAACWGNSIKLPSCEGGLTMTSVAGACGYAQSERRTVDGNLRWPVFAS
jgi:hypothetical protein